jgi:hypothetical protein
MVRGSIAHIERASRAFDPTRIPRIDPRIDLAPRARFARRASHQARVA